MKDLVFLDTETTGNDLLADRLFQVCYAVEENLVSESFMPPLPISVKSQSITHITNKMIADKFPFADSQMKKDLQELLKDKILVAHNAVFDICMLSHEGVEVSKFICTLKVARFLDSDDKFPEYNLQYLRYLLELDVTAEAHSADGDVKVLKALFNYLYGRMLETYGDHESVIAKMIEVSAQPFMFKLFNFGKHRGKRIEEVAGYDRKYLQWLLSEKMQNAQAEEDWIFTLKHFLSKS